MMVKIIGAALLVACGGALGLGRLHAAGGRIALLNMLDRALSMIEAEISLCSRPLPDVFEQLRRETDCELFAALSESCAYLSAGDAWRLWAEGLELPPEGKVVIGSLGEVLGRYDASRQSGEIRAVRERLKGMQENLQREKETKQRHYPVLGACLAGIAAMLMI